MVKPFQYWFIILQTALTIFITYLVKFSCGKVSCIASVVDLCLMYVGGYIPRDAPVPVVLTSSLAECIIAGVVSSIGILSSIFFFVFNLYYCKHP